MIAAAIHCNAANYLRVNQIGYIVDDVKVAVIMMEHGDAPTSFCVVNADSGKKTVMHSVKPTGEFAGFAQTARLDFSKVKTPGTYYITAAGAKSSSFRIANDAYAGAQEVPLNYMRQQRCGWNPLMRDSCHRYDGRLQLCGDRDGEHVDVRGGWHDASDYLQYLTTSANAVYQMLFAYSQNPSVWADNFQADGTEGANGIPDILDEARWGLEWMLKMNPDDNTFLNQIADDRDHRSPGLPNKQMADYGWGAGKDRPVYPCIGSPTGLREYKNRSRGLASSVAKFSSSFALGAKVFETLDPAFASTLLRKSGVAYDVAKANPGNCQTVCTVSPYFYEEDNWTDDLELAAATIAACSGSEKMMSEAVDWERQEPVTPWCPTLSMVSVCQHRTRIGCNARQRATARRGTAQHAVRTAARGRQSRRRKSCLQTRHPFHLVQQQPYSGICDAGDALPQAVGRLPVPRNRNSHARLALRCESVG